VCGKGGRAHPKAAKKVLFFAVEEDYYYYWARKSISLSTCIMPRNLSKENRLIEEASSKFSVDVAVYLRGRGDNETLRRFKDLIAELKISHPPLAAVACDVVMRRFNECMQDYPEMCNNSVVGVRPNGVLLLKEMMMEVEEVVERRMMMVGQFSAPVATSRFFTRDDVALCIIQHLPYPSLGRLAQTCKWMNTSITDKHVEHAVDRFLKRFQKIELFDEPPLIIISSSSPRFEQFIKTKPNTTIQI